jgi:nucleotide sugar dehydrogenase
MKKNISIIGVGKLGLCLSLNLESKGYNVLGVDVSQDYVNTLNSKKYETSEPYVSELLKKSKNIKFTTNLKDSLTNDIIFIVVKTPSTNDWKYDHYQIDEIVDKLISFGVQKNTKDIIINSTTFPGYCDTVQRRLEKFNYRVSYNPEFIAQGSIIHDQLNCDNVLIGGADETSSSIIREIYENMCDSNPIINTMTRTEAEITKLSVNCFLTTKISYANMIGDIALRYNCNPNIVLNAIGTDSRIGNKYLKYGFGFGGPCFPRDNRALTKCAEEVGVDAILAKSTDEMNDRHLDYQIENFVETRTNKEEEVVIDYVSYKKESASLEESQQLKYALKLKTMGYNIKILDNRPEVLEQLKNLSIC